MSQEQGTGGAALGRYQDLGLIGQGSMAEVRRVWDPALDRAVAMKILRINLVRNPLASSRFKKEARAIARLQHPGVIPIHDLGVLPDGRPYYTMKEIWSVRRLIETLHRVSEAVAFAHSRGILHRDLKPENVLVGRFGEVLVVDWGLAKAFGAERPLANTGALNTADISAAGSVSGTPAYMAPEQAVAGPMGPPTDVYALGAMLYEILGGRPPYSAPNAWLVLLQLKTGPPPLLSALPGVSVPDELARIVNTAIAREPSQRFPDAGAMAADLGAWLDGARKRDRGAALIAEADGLIGELNRERAQSAALAGEAREILAALPRAASIEQKRPAWTRQREAAEAEQRAGQAERAAIDLLYNALSEAPDLAEARERLADLFRARHAAAENRRDPSAAAEAEAALRAHDRGRYAGYLDGAGTVTLTTDPPGATALLFRYTLQDRQLTPVFERSLGLTPLNDVPLPMGSWRIDLCLPGRSTVIYPVSLGREERATGLAPGELAPRPIPLLPEGALRPHERLIPPGWFWFGGEPGALTAPPPSRAWTDAWVAGRFPITNQEYLVFLNDLAQRGHEDQALRHAPRQRSGPGGPGALVYRWQDGAFSLRSDPEGDLWMPDYPVLLVDWEDASAYASWLAARDGRPWQLLPEAVWEKAARGVDARLYPWGDELDPTFCCMKESGDRPLPASVIAFPIDESPYGVRGMAGNARDWCATAVGGDGPERRVVRGGGWLDGPAELTLTRRDAALPQLRQDFLGFRLGWPLNR